MGDRFYLEQRAKTGSCIGYQSFRRKRMAWEEDKKQGKSYNAMTNFYFDPISKEYIEIMEEFWDKTFDEFKNMNTKGNA